MDFMLVSTVRFADTTTSTTARVVIYIHTYVYAAIFLVVFAFLALIKLRSLNKSIQKYFRKASVVINIVHKT